MVRETMTVLPISLVIPTISRPGPLARTLDSLAAQGEVPVEIIVIDGSDGDETREVVRVHAERWSSASSLVWQRASELGAAAQRNQGVVLATRELVCFCDDDMLFERSCLRQLWQAIEADERLGGVSAMITNQRYEAPGFVSRAVFTILAGRRQHSFAGQVLGPAVNLLPEDRADLPDVVPVQWLNLGCTLYRQEALPAPPFDSAFRGYSLMEDLTLSLRVGRSWTLANVRSARVHHDSQPGHHKSNPEALARMELVNRHYVMHDIMGRRSRPDLAKLVFWELFQLIVLLLTPGRRRAFPAVLRGKVTGMREVLATRRS
jgi:glycosyltransferase involved in cell wall biosynthesis